MKLSLSVVYDKEFGRYLCKPRFMRGNMKTGACFESDFAQNQPGFNFKHVNGEC